VNNLDVIYNNQKEKEETHNFVLDNFYNKLEGRNKKLKKLTNEESSSVPSEEFSNCSIFWYSLFCFKML